MTDEEKLTLIQKYEDLPEEEFKEECFEDLKKLAFDKDDTVKTFTASVLLLPVHFHVLQIQQNSKTPSRFYYNYVMKKMS